MADLTLVLIPNVSTEVSAGNLVVRACLYVGTVATIDVERSEFGRRLSILGARVRCELRTICRCRVY